MEVFEIHITGDRSIHKVAAAMGMKTIGVELYRPDGSYFRTEHMTSHVERFHGYQACKDHVDAVVDKLVEAGVEIKRVKIECPTYYAHYRKQSKYIESHFKAEDFNFPVSRNLKKTSMLATDRRYEQDKYAQFEKMWSGKTKEIELCLYDTKPEEDKDWLDMYQAVWTMVGLAKRMEKSA